MRRARPPRPQSEVLSYLLFGKPLSGTSKEDQGTLTGAAGSLGGQLLASQIGRQLGLDELSVSGTGDKAALTEQQVREWCQAQLTGYKRPRVVEFRTDLPKTPVGKILRRELRDQP